MTPEPRGEPGALLRPDAARTKIDLSRQRPRATLEPFVDYLWVVRWDLEQPYTQPVLTQPKIHLVVEDGRVRAHGVSRRRFRRVLRGQGKAIGVAFRAGGFRPFLRPGERVGSLENKVVLADELWSVDDVAIARRAMATGSDEAMGAVIEDFLESRGAIPDPVCAEVAELVAMIERNRWLRRVDELARESGLSVRALQRLFKEYVGAAPKWVIQRRRLLDAAELANAGGEVMWADLAAALGYSDQAHLVRDFTAAVGIPPARYTRTVTTSGSVVD